MRALAILSVMLMSACVLHSKAPLFPDAEAVALLGNRPVTMTVTVTVTATDPAKPFKAIPARLDLLPEGNHYRVAAPGPKGPTDLAFVPLGQDSYAVQYGVGAGHDYALATWDGSAHFSSPRI